MLELMLHSHNTKQKEAVSLHDIAKKYAISFYFLQKIARLLRTKELICASRGKNGGYILSKNPNTITLYQIFSALEGPIRLKSCFTPTLLTPGHGQEIQCHMPARQGLGTLNRKIQNIFLETTLKSFGSSP